MPTNIDAVAAPDKASDSLLSVKQAAALLNMSEGWLYQSGIPYVKLGRRRLYRRIDIYRYIEQRLSHAKQRAE